MISVWVGVGSSSQVIYGCFLFINSRMGKIPDSLYTKDGAYIIGEAQGVA